MGVSVRYRGQIDDLERIEEFEDRVMAVVYSLGGQINVWRSYSEEWPGRTMRGLVIEVAPGQESLSLILSPEGYFTPLQELNRAETKPYDQAPECAVETERGGLVGHLTVCHLLGAIRCHFASNLQIEDESGFWDSQDVGRLHDSFGRTLPIDASSQISWFGLSSEAAEDVGILNERSSRVKKLLDERMKGDFYPSDRSSGLEPDPWGEVSLEVEVQKMDQVRRDNELRNERISRVVRDAIANGGDIEEAVKTAFQSERPVDSEISLELWDPPNYSEPPHEHALEALFGLDVDCPEEVDDENEDEESLIRHPALEAAEVFYLDVIAIFQSDSSNPEAWVTHSNGLVAAAGDIVGGLVQATMGNLVEPTDGEFSLAFESRSDRALAITQLKRAQRGHRFARGAILSLDSLMILDEDIAYHLVEDLGRIQRYIRELIELAWDESVF